MSVANVGVNLGTSQGLEHESTTSSPPMVEAESSVHIGDVRRDDCIIRSVASMNRELEACRSLNDDLASRPASTITEDCPHKGVAGQSPKRTVRGRGYTSGERSSWFTQVASVFGGLETQDDLGFRPYNRPASRRVAGQIFADANALKAKVLQNLKKPEYNVFDYYHSEGWAQAIAKSQTFDYITLGVIGFNALWIAIDTDENKSKVITSAPPVFQVAEHTFCTFFTFELLVRFLSFRRKLDVLRDGWFCFDFALVALMVTETWIITIVSLLARNDDQETNSLDIFRVFRLLRLSRVARMVRLLRSVPELMILIKGMATAVRSVFFTLVLLLINIYVFAILFTQLTEESETDVGEKFFNTVWLSMYTLLLRGVLLDTPGLVSTALNEESPAFTVLFFVFVLLGALTVMNMLIGVLCEVVGVVASVEKEEMLISFVKSRLQHIVEELDENGDNQISRHEFLKILENPDAAAALSDVGVDVVGLIDFVDHIFDDDSFAGGHSDEVELTFPDFMEVVLSLRGTNTATVKDVINLRKFVRTGAQSTASHLSHMGDRISRIEDNLRRIESMLLSSGLRPAASGNSSSMVHQHSIKHRRQEDRNTGNSNDGFAPYPHSKESRNAANNDGFAPHHFDSKEYEAAKLEVRGPSRTLRAHKYSMPPIAENGWNDHSRSPSKPTQQPREDAGCTPRSSDPLPPNSDGRPSPRGSREVAQGRPSAPGCSEVAQGRQSPRGCSHERSASSMEYGDTSVLPGSPREADDII